ncbi:hypothetical protein [Bryobacter aggregatus]|uniref:hypothetical protein n=1 Tax=Bryobacter aggregatus TaxID=360054 RepID=UPI0004E0BABA|nr:hypothetical protein [Bryobacter aggregatus]
MITLFPYSRPVSSSEDGAARLLSLLTQSLQANLIRAKSLNHEAVSTALDAAWESVKSDQPEASILEKGKEVCASIQQYFRGLTGSIDSVGIDLATSIRALATLLHRSAGTQTQLLAGLENVRERFEAGQTLDDIHLLRGHLDSCLSALRTEITTARKTQQENQDDLAQHLSKMNQHVSVLRSHVPPDPAVGPAVSILRLRRIQAIRERYGEVVAQRLMDHVIQILLVRWPAAHDISPFTEECLVVVDSQNLDLDFHRAALRRLAGERITFSTQHEGHEIVLPIAIDWTVIRVPKDGNLQSFVTSFLDGMRKKDTQVASLDKLLAFRP